MRTSTQLYDIVVYDKYGQPAAVVEVKGGRGIPEEVARKVAVHLWEMGAAPPPSVKYFLLLTLRRPQGSARADISKPCVHRGSVAFRPDAGSKR